MGCSNGGRTKENDDCKKHSQTNGTNGGDTKILENEFPNVSLVQNIDDRMSKINIDNLVIITDFDFTLTRKFKMVNGAREKLQSAYGVMEVSDLLPPSYKEDKLKQLNFYLPKEDDLTLTREEKEKFMDDWAKDGMKSLLDLQITTELIDKIVKLAIEKQDIMLRDSTDKLFEFALENNITIYILSAGLANIIDSYLTQSLPVYSKLKEKKLITICSNEIYFDPETKIATSHNEPSLNTFTKSDNLKKIFTHKNVDAIVLGDHYNDVTCTEKIEDLAGRNNIGIAFVNENQKVAEEEKAHLDIYKKKWDVIVFGDGSFDYHLNTLNKIKNNNCKLLNVFGN